MLSLKSKTMFILNIHLGRRDLIIGIIKNLNFMLYIGGYLQEIGFIRLRTKRDINRNVREKVRKLTANISKLVISGLIKVRTFN